jgi:hypothetical protein
MSKRDDELLSTLQVAEELGITIRRVVALIKAGRLPSRVLNPSRKKSAHLVRRGDLELVRERKPGRPRLE